MVEIKPYSEQYLLLLARLYDRVFTNAPWFDPPLGESKAMAYIQQELKKTMSIALLAINNLDQPVGFGWGYQLNWQQFSQTKYQSPNGQKIISEFRPNDTIPYFYISEVGIDPQMQGQGLGSKITEKLSQQPVALLMRTLNSSPMLAIAINKISLSPIVAPWLEFQDPENPNRVILNKKC